MNSFGVYSLEKMSKCTCVFVDRSCPQMLTSEGRCATHALTSEGRCATHTHTHTNTSEARYATHALTSEGRCINATHTHTKRGPLCRTQMLTSAGRWAAVQDTNAHKRGTLCNTHAHKARAAATHYIDISIRIVALSILPGSPNALRHIYSHIVALSISPAN